MTSTDLVPVPPTSWLRASDGIFAGVAQGLAKRFGLDPWLVRAAWLVSICAFGTGILLYVVLAFCLPREDDAMQGQERRLWGVCLRISQKAGFDVGLVRTAAVFLTFASAGMTVLVYVILNFVLEPERETLVC
jgi:phage shock protein PspC (stress-responsive transcriptional regulator)